MTTQTQPEPETLEEPFAEATPQELVALVGEYEIAKRLLINKLNGVLVENQALKMRVGQLEDDLKKGKKPPRATVPKQRRG